MAYVGQQPVVGRYILLDQISGGFNGTATGFTMTAGGQGVIPGLAQNVLLSLGGVIQQPGVDYLVSGSGLTFTTAPVSGTTFFATVLGDAQAVGTPSDGTVIPASIASSGIFVFPNVTVSGVTTIASGSAAAPSLSISGDANTGLYSAGADQLSIATSGTARLSIDGSGNINILQENAGPTYPEQRLKWSNDSTTANGFYISQGTDRNGKIWHEQGLDIQFATSNTERMRLDSSGRLGIGTSAPAQLLHVKSSSAYGVIVADNNGATGGGLFGAYQNGAQKAAFGVSGAIEGNTTSDLGLFADSTGGAIRFYTNGSPATKAIIDSSGRLLVGTSSARSWAGVNSNLQVEGTTWDNSSASFTRNSADSVGGALALGKSRGTALGSHTVVQSGDFLGRIHFVGADGSALIQGASITGEVDGTPGSNDMPGRLVFSTTADGASSPTERMRIRSSGEVLVNSTALLDLNGQAFQVNGWSMFYQANTGTTASAFTHIQSGTQTVCLFRQGNPAATVGSISVSGGTTTTYNTSSDYRLKENVVEISDGIDRLLQLKPSRFNFISNPGKTVDGFIAHEVQDIVPEAITGEKDAVDDEGNPIYQGIDQSKLVPLLTAALQEAVAKIESLEARLTAAGI